MLRMSEEEHITVTCQNCGEEITNSRAYFKQRDGSVLIAAAASSPTTNKSSLTSDLFLRCVLWPPQATAEARSKENGARSS